MKKKNKNYLIIGLLVLLVSIPLGYAAFSETLNIKGIANVSSTTAFDLNFTEAKISNSKGIDTSKSQALITNSNNTLDVKIVDLAYPGAGADVTVTITNAGTIDATLKNLKTTGIDGTDLIVTLPQELKQGIKIPAKGSSTITFSVNWNAESKNVKPADCNFSVEMVYEQDTTAHTPAQNYTPNV